MNQDFTEIYKAMDVLGQQLIRDLTKNLLKLDKKASGELINSLDYDVLKTVNGFTLSLISADYLKYVDEGRRPGKQPPIQSMIKWVDLRHIKFRNKKGRFIKKEQTAFLIARSIGRRGIKPTHVVSNTIKELRKNITQLLEKATIRDIEKMIDKIKI